MGRKACFLLGFGTLLLSVVLSSGADAQAIDWYSDVYDVYLERGPGSTRLAGMGGLRLAIADEGREFNLFSPTIPVLFQNKDKIKTVVETTDKGAIMTQTSGDAAVVAALQAHAGEVTELVRDGRFAMMRSAQAAMAMGRRPFATPGPQTPPPDAPVTPRN